MWLYTATTADEYEFPIYVADSAAELAKVLGLSSNSVSSQISHQSKNDREGKKRPSSKNSIRYYRIRVGEVSSDD